MNLRLIALVLLLTCATAGADDAPSVLVQTQTPQRGTLPETITAYGTAVPAINGGMTLSVQAEGRVMHLLVTPGEAVHAGQTLLEFQLSAAASSAYEQAQSALKLARQEQARTARLLAQQLATRDQQAQADKAAGDAEAALNALEQENGGKPRQTIAAPFDGVVGAIPVAQGERVQPGAALVTVTRAGGLVITVGIEPAQRRKLKLGQPATLESLDAASDGEAVLHGKLVRIDKALNPKTRLVDADLVPDSGTEEPLQGQAFRAGIEVGQVPGWLLPRNAVLDDEQGAYLFQVADGKAVRVNVKRIGGDDGTTVVVGPVDPARPLVTIGNYQLADGMAVRQDEAPAAAECAAGQTRRMNFVAQIERHARSILVIALALAVAGVVAALSLPVGLFPQVSFPRVVVDLSAGDRPADETALTLTRPVEEAIRSVPGVREVRSASSRGSAQVSIDFGWGRDMIATTLLVDSAIAQILPQLPPGTAYGVRRMDPTVFPIISYALTSDTQTPSALHDLAQLQLVPLLASVPGLARVGVQGGDIDEVEVLADPHRLDAYGLGLSDLVTALAANNVLQAVGRVQDHDKLYLVVSNSDVRRVEQLADIVLRSDAGSVVRLRNVAEVRRGAVPQWIRVSEDGKPAVLLNVYEQPDGNAVQIAAEVRSRLAGFQLPQGVKLSTWYDQSVLVVQSAGSVRDAVLIGLLLAGIVLILFLRNWRVTLIALLVVPATLAVTVLLLKLLGMSFNIMTLGGIAAAVGLVIDDVIVMIEHIARRAGAADHGDGQPRGREAVLPAAREFMLPLTGSSLATLIVFLPLSLLSGVTGAFSKALAVTMGAALVISWLMAAFVVPVLARSLIDFQRWHDPAAGREGWLERRHARLLDRLLRRPGILALLAVPLLLLGALAYNGVQSGFMPKVDDGGFVMDFYTLPGTSLTETERELAQVEAILRGMPEVDTWSRRTGTGLGGDLGEPHHGDFFVRLKARRSRASEAVMSDVLAQVESKVPGVQVELAQLMEDLIGDLTAVPQPIEIKLYATDPALLIPQARKVAAAIGKLDGVVEVKDGVVLAGDGIDLKVDPVKAAIEGVTPDQVTKAVDTALTGAIATQMPEAAKVVDVRVRLPDALGLNQSGLADLPIRAADGHLFPLRRVATLTPVSGQPEISRDNLQPMVAVTARIEGRGIGAAVGDVRQTLAQAGMLQAGVRYELGGLYQQQQIAFAGLARVFAAALAAEFILLLLLYEQFWLPLIIIGSSLLSTTAVFTGLWLTGVDLNITALMGMTMIIGIATEMSIFYVSEYTELARRMPPRQALREASRNRLRPITMTTLAAILTLLPLALAIGQGSAIQQPLAIAIISGLLIQFPLVLLAMPVLIGLTLPRNELSTVSS